MSKRLISMLLALAALLSLAAPALADGGEQPAGQTEPVVTQTAPEQSETAGEPAGPVETVSDEAGPVEDEDEGQEPVEGAVATLALDEPDDGIMLLSLGDTYKKQLQDAVSEAPGKEAAKDTFTTESWTPFETALKNARDVLANEEITDDKDSRYQAAYNALNDAATKLTTDATDAEVKALQALVDKVDQLQKDPQFEDKYTQTSKQTLTQKYEAAKSALQAEPPQHKAVVEATKPLEEALALKGETVTAKILHSGYYAKQAQADEALKALDSGATVDGDDTMYVHISAPDTEVDNHNYYFTATLGENVLKKEKLDFRGKDTSGLVVAWKPSDLKADLELKDKDQIVCVLSSYFGTYSTSTVLKEEARVTITIDRSYEGPVIAASGYVLKGDAEKPELTDQTHDVMYVKLDTDASKNAGDGYTLELIDPAKKVDLIKSGIKAGARFEWTWDEGAKTAELKNTTLAVGSYTVNLYALKVNEDATVNKTLVSTATITVPAVDTKPLTDAVTEANKKTPLDADHWVTKAEVESAAAALTAVNELLGKAGQMPKSTANNETVTAKAQALTTALAVLEEKLDCSELQQKINEGAAILPGTFTAGSFTTLQTAVNNAKSFVAGEPAANEGNKTALAGHIKAIQDAIDGLTEAPAEWTDFDAALAAAKQALTGAESSGKYTAGTVQALKDAIAAAEAVQAKKDTLKAKDQKQINDATAALTEAAKLEERADTKALEEAIKKAEALNASDYESFSAVQSALANAKALTNAPVSKQADVDAAAKALTDAIAALKERVLADYVYGGGKWVYNSGKWYYQVNGANQTNAWIKSYSKWYYVAQNGVMAKGWTKVDGKWYYFNPGTIKGSSTGAMQKGWLTTGTGTYFLDGGGAMVTGWRKVDGKWYYFNPGDVKGYQTGAMLKSKWLYLSGTWYYLGKDGVMYKSCLSTIGGRKYGFKGSGAMVKGWSTFNGVRYYFNPGNISGSPTGAMITNRWIYDSGTWYYATANGSLRTNGKYTIGGYQYYFNSNGVMVTGWKKISGVWYYFDPGADDGYPTGAMIVNGWITDDGARYYLGSSGAMYTGSHVISGKTFYFSGSGAMLTGWRTDGPRRYYYRTVNDEGATGAMAANEWMLIGNDWYYFYSDGRMAYNTVIDGYKIGADGTRA